jgi:protein-S-isoprenylcysteine O-methyltransferase Ste14
MSGLRLVGTALYLASFPALLVLLGGSSRWVEAWLFSAWFVALCTTCIAWLYRKDPALLAERYRRPGSGGQRGWDAAVVYALLAGFIAWIVVMPLDRMRLGWTPPLPIAAEVCGGTMLLPSAFLFFRSFTDNTFLSPLVRIQSERKQRVVTTGVYAFVRHPMYLGATLMFLGVPLLLGSRCGVVLGAALTLLISGRIVGEEKLLERELEGYTEYRTKVRYRLLPFIW